jgi:lipopolysaccharide/colanic/teichoic acid biosynthesis glycosyltransferase
MQTCNAPLSRQRAVVANHSEIWNREAFEALIVRERAVAERLDVALALVAFEVATHPRSGAENNRIDALRDHWRSNCVVGWLTNNRLGVLLPSTTPDDVGGLLNGLRQNLSEVEAESLHPVVSWYPNGARERAVAEDAVPAMPWWKRGIDVLAATIGLILISPLMLLVGLYIKLSSRGPVFFRQERIGYLGRTFIIWKFRTMAASAGPKPHQDYVCQLTQSDSVLKKRDGRSELIPLGRWLRASCIDEIPQLFNVLGGSMSLVGPRPDVVPLGFYRPWQLRRFMAVPGMTGLWQVSGKNRLTVDEMVRLDIAYAQRLSPGLDARILIRTVPAIFQQLFDRSPN